MVEICEDEVTLVTNQERSPYTVPNWLSRAMTAVTSENSAIAEYDSIIASPDIPSELIDKFNEIRNDERDHMAILSELVSEYNSREHNGMSEAANIKAKNPGILEVPDDRNVMELPVSHFKELIDKRGREAIIRAITNLQVWHEKDNPKISSWAKKMKQSLKDYGKK
jgi:rubrerythrin